MRITTDSLRYDAGQGRDLWRPSVLHGSARRCGNVALFLHVISEAKLGEGREREFVSDYSLTKLCLEGSYSVS